MKLEYKRLESGTLYAHVHCRCNLEWRSSTGEERIANMKTNIRFLGKDSKEFWLANAKPAEGECYCCKRKYIAQWLPEGLEFEWVD